MVGLNVEISSVLDTLWEEGSAVQNINELVRLVETFSGILPNNMALYLKTQPNLKSLVLGNNCNDKCIILTISS